MMFMLQFANFNYMILVWIFIGIVLLGLISWPLMCFIAARFVYFATLCRKTKEQWNRGVPSCDEPEQIAMYNEGLVWHKNNVDKKVDVHIVNNGYNLYGEYYDFGYDRCVIILSGRTENLEYGYYFAAPYVESGYNVLVVDPRAHGQSDGKYNTVGYEESKDALMWASYIHNNFGVKFIIFHGICIGAAAGIFAMTSDNCPDYIQGLVAEGMFATFSESMKNHLIERKKPVFMINSMINFWMKFYTGHSMKYGPINVINKMKKPLLMIHSKEDLYSLPDLAEKLYNTASSEQKELVWYEHGRHSMLRITDTPKYDQAIINFISSKINNN